MKLKRAIREKLSIQVAKNPSGTILIAILVLNVAFFLLSALFISMMAPKDFSDMGFWESVFYTVSMILDAGCISYVIQDIGEVSVALIILCIIIVVVGSITFTGAVIGYVTNYISGFIASANDGDMKLKASNHTIILGWNTRASEIINDLLYSETSELVIVLVNNDKSSVEREIKERLTSTIERENEIVRKKSSGLSSTEARKYIKKNSMKNRVTVIVREGDTFSTQKLMDISIMDARDIIILADDLKSTVCKYDYQERLEKFEKGNSNTVKTLIQVAEMTGSAESADNQKIVVEIGDEWTDHLVERIISHKEIGGKCNIVPIKVNKVLGQILSQFSIMPELNTVYGELFSNKGAQFYSRDFPFGRKEKDFIEEVLREDLTAVPLTSMDGKSSQKFYFMADSEKDVNERITPSIATVESKLIVKPVKKFWLEKRNIIILGHNSKINAVMDGFKAFGKEWDFADEELIAKYGSKEILDIEIVDDARSMERMNDYKEYPFVTRAVTADIYSRELIKEEVVDFINSHEGDTSILILSDDMVNEEEIDSTALTYLIYVQDIIAEFKQKNKNFDPESIDVVVEILNPKNYDIVHSYSIDNIVISNRYISRMITQIGEKEDIFNFYSDILTYDDNNSSFDSKELYIKKVSRFFDEVPQSCTAAELIRKVYEATPEDNKSIVLGYVRKGGEMKIFSGNQENIKLHLRETDKLIIFSNH